MSVITFTPKDAYAVMNTLVHQATGDSSIAVVDTSSFIDAGTKTLEAGYENVYNALGVLIGTTIVAARPYQGKFKLVAYATANAFENRIRKISYYARDNQASGAFNTDLYTNLGEGLNDESGAGSMWEQNPAIPVERYFYSSYVWDKSHTQYIEQIKEAFTNESSFIDFINGIMIEVQNDIESTIEARNRMLVLDRIAGEYLMAGNGDIGKECAVNLTAEFNKEFGTSYTTAQIEQSHLNEFCEFYVAYMKILSDRLTNRTALYHDPMTLVKNEGQANEKTYKVLRHTPKDKQKFVYYAPFFTKAKARVFPEIFNPQYLDFKNGEGVDYWQSFNSPESIQIKPALPDGATSADVKLNKVIGILFDTDAIGANNKFEGMYATPVNARHLYTNMFWHYKYGAIQDYSENAVVLYMADEVSADFTGDGTAKTFTVSDKPAFITKVTVAGEEVDVTSYVPSTGVVTLASAPADDAAVKVYYEK